MSSNLVTITKSVATAISFVKDNVRTNFPQILENAGVSLSDSEYSKVVSLVEASIDQAWSRTSRSVEIAINESLSQERVNSRAK